MRHFGAILFTTTLFYFVLIQSSAAAQKAKPDTGLIIGTWYSTWYSDQGNINWLHNGVIPGTALLGDVTGDGKDDLVIVQNGQWLVYKSTGKLFDSGSVWLKDFGGSPDDVPLLGDMNGDGREDAVVFNKSTGQWRVAYANSSGEHFLPPKSLIDGNGFGQGSSRQFLADVVGDHKAHPVVFYADSGEWRIWLDGKSESWIMAFGKGSDNQFLGDVNGDGIADAVTFDKSTGCWMAALSAGNGFGTPRIFKNDVGKGSDNQFLYDINGDEKADAIFFDKRQDISWFVSYNGSNEISGWKWGGFGNKSNAQWVCDPYGDHRGSIITYTKADNLWQVLTGSDKSRKPNVENLWQAWDVKYLPWTLGKFQQYDCINPAVLDDHLKMLASAGVDFLITDETNGIHVDFDFIYQRDLMLGKRIAVWNANPRHRKMRRAFAIGGCNSTGKPETIEEEAKDVWMNVVTPEGPTVYYNLNGKPLLVVYTYLAMKQRWEAAAIDKTYADKFTIRWAEGPDHPGYYGWATPVGGAEPDKDCMFITPRRTIDASDIWGRDENFYISEWRKVLRVKPQIVVIGDYNDYLENNWWAPTDTHLLPMPGSPGHKDNHFVRSLDNSGKLDPFLYWNITTAYIKAMRTGQPVVKNWK
jgi:hypothetical protein